MKYIRTKDGHLLKEHSRQKRLNGEYDTWYKGNGASLLYNHDHNAIEKEADTIEELCDEFVKHCLPHSFYLVITKTSYIMSLIKQKKFATEYEIKNGVYGAIWTDKGLIYVAKMNDKGELELL